MIPFNSVVVKNNVDQICAFNSETATIEANPTTRELTTRDTAYQWGRGYINYQFGYSTDLGGTISVINGTVENFFRQAEDDLQECLQHPSPENQRKAQQIIETETSLLSGLNQINSAYRRRDVPPADAQQVDTLTATIQKTMKRLNDHQAKVRTLPQEEKKGSHSEIPVRVHLPSEEASASAVSGLWGAVTGGLTRLFGPAPADNNRAQFAAMAPALIDRLEALHSDDVEGIFRLAPDAQELNAFMAELESPGSIDHQDDVHVLATALKRLMRNMKPPVLVANEALRAAIANADPREAARAIFALVNKGDAQFQAAFFRLLQYLKGVSENPASKMTPANLGVVWGPNMVQAPDDPMAALTMAKAIPQAVALMIEHYDLARPA